MRREVVSLTTDASGDVTAFGSALQGALYAIQLVDGTFDDGVDVTVTCENEDLSIPLLVGADWNTDKMLYPRVLQNLNTDATALTTHCEPLVYGRIKVVIAQGGNAKSGKVICYVRERL